ncbi:DUF6480 family protein [Arthrobacter zhaoguopingii]|uniref:DUF6480 family protein n=1 Tax=Arthrobacter zhaoguopingii TaxID=2681491 RepID=UPI00135ADE14|nr:DUF6480 family protein [Arthrobacter zhaoguopingii]
MSAANPDPKDDNLTGLEPGGGVPPGETPPGEASTAAQQGHGEAGPSKGFSRIWLAVTGIIVLLFLLFFVGYIANFF